MANPMANPDLSDCFYLFIYICFSLLIRNLLLTLFQTITKLEPEFLAIHCQEVGGKNYEDTMQHVNKFIK